MLGMQLKNDSYLFAKVVCPNACKYVLKIKKQTDRILDLDPGFSETGTLYNQELKLHLVKPHHYDGNPIERTYTFKLQVASGNADM